MAMGIEKLGLPSITIPELFLAEKISLFPSPPTSPPPPPGLVHPSSSPGIVRPAIIPQNVRETYIPPIRRGTDPGTFNRAVIGVAASYKSAVQGGLFGDAYTKVVTIKGPPSPPHSDNSSGYESPPKRINPKIVELIRFLRSPWK